MAKLDRKDVKIFAEDCDNTLVAEFRTEDEVQGTASYSRDPDMIQNANYSQGWVENTDNLNTKIYGEDLNAVNYVLSYLLKYLYENGIAEWKSTTTYYTNSITRVDDVLYISLIDDNTGNDPTNTVGCWRAVVLDTITSTIAGAGSDIVKGITGNQITFKSISVDGYASLTDNGDQLNIHVLGGGGIVDAFWGQIQGTLSNQTDLVSALGAKQDTITVDSPLSIDVDNELSIPKATTLASGYLDYNDFNTFNGKQNALTGFTHTYDSDDDEATIEPSATTSNIGSDSYPISNINASNLKADSITPQTSGVGYVNFTTDIHAYNVKAGTFSDNYSKVTMAYNDDDNLTFDLGDSQNTSTGDIKFSINEDSKLSIRSDKVIVGVDLYPNANSNCNIGSSTRTFEDGYINNTISNTVTTDNYKNNINYINALTIFTDFNFGSTYYYNDGTNNEMSILNIQSIYDSGRNTITEILPQKTNASTSHFCSLGNSTQRFAEGYFRNLDISNYLTAKTIYSNNLIPNANSTYKVGESNSNYFLESYIRKMYVGEIHIGAGNNNTVWLYTNNDIRFENESSSGTVNVYSGQSGTSNLGTSGHKWNNVWTEKINGSNYSPSDRDKKENINKRNDETKGKKTSLEVINSLETYTYNYKDDKDKTIHIGIMAQDLQNEVPECVVDNGESNEKGEHEKDLYIDVMGYVTVLTEAVKQLSAKVETLEKEVAELKGQTK